MNNDDANIYNNNDENVSYSVFANFHYFNKL